MKVPPEPSLLDTSSALQAACTQPRQLLATFQLASQSWEGGPQMPLPWLRVRALGACPGQSTEIVHLLERGILQVGALGAKTTWLWSSSCLLEASRRQSQLSSLRSASGENWSHGHTLRHR